MLSHVNQPSSPPSLETIRSLEHTAQLLNKKHPLQIITHAGTLRLNEDPVEAQREHCLARRLLDNEQTELMDDNEARQGFFDKNMTDFESEVGLTNAATKQFTSLRHFRIKQQRH